MRSRIESAAALLLAAALAVSILVSCSKQDPGAIGHNLPPETTLSFVSEPGDTVSAEVHLQWMGVDEDGEVVGYQARWDTLDWFGIAVTDSVFVLATDEGRDSLGSFRHHTFSVRSIDDDGEFDPTPATLSFTARNTFPETEIIHGPALVTSPMVCFEWRGWDYDGVVVGYGYSLYADYGGEWVEIAGDDSLPPDQFEMVVGPLAGLHRFEVWSIDDDGAQDPTPAAREFTSDPELGGRYLRIRSNVLGNASFRGPVWPAWADSVVLDIFEGEELVFDWDVADEDAFTCPVYGFSYAYDDTSEWCQSYSLYDTHFEVTPGLGEHSLYVAVMSSFGIATRGRIRINVVPTTLNDHILIVDDYEWRENQPTWGTDEMRDAFYDTLTAGYVRPVLQWDAWEHGGIDGPQPPDVATLARASTVIWYVDSDQRAIAGLFHPLSQRSPHYSRLDGYVRAGGNLILCGFKPLEAIADEPGPLQFAASDTTPDRVFIRDRLRIGAVDNSGSAANPDVPWQYGYCFYGAVPGGTGIPGDRTVQLEAIYIDSVGPSGFPEPGKWPFYADPPPPYPGLLRCGLPTVEAYEPYGASPIESHVIDSFLNYNFEGRTCVMLSPTGSDRGNVCCIGFPLYYCQTAHVKAVFDELLPMFGEHRP